MRVLITNDDGFDAKGIIALYNAFREVASVTVVAPHIERSGIGHAITFFKPLRIWKLRNEENLKIYATTGTPTDCVMLATHYIDRGKFDLLVSGINRGANMGDDITYSGTVSTALEGTLQRIPSIAISLASFKSNDYSVAASFAVFLGRQIVEKGLPPNTFLNVNVPALKKSQIKGVSITYQGRSKYRQKIIRRVDPQGKEYFWITGDPPTGEPEKGSDFEAVYNGRISVTPLHLSMCHCDALNDIEKVLDFSEYISTKVG